jgi:hypothetical protein
MRIVVLLLSGILFAVSAQAQSFNSYTLSPVGLYDVQPHPPPSGTPQPSDVVFLRSSIGLPNCPNCYTAPAALPLSAFASAADIQNVNSRIDQAYQQINNNYNQLVQQINNSNIQLSRGVAAATALSGTFMPSAPGRTSWAVNGSAFNGEFGAGLSLAYRLNVSVPIAVTAAYGNGGGTANVGRVGLMGEF